ncbi:hypothetical protein PENSPDRAFT_736026 [Peniophora sp. CONT]|nr:hypothetical protein PENSPDRAFT_736026 [Peniophora sp. CONT]
MNINVPNVLPPTSTASQTPRESITQFTAQLLRDVDATMSHGGGDLQYLRQLDADTEHLVNTAFQLRRRRNACAPFLRLPQELLEKIIMTVAMSGWQPSASLRIGWIMITHVCHELRMVALQLQKLWADNAFYLQAYWRGCQETLSRAGGIPLSIAIRDAGDSTRSNVSAILKLFKENLVSARSVVIDEEYEHNTSYNNLWPYQPSHIGGRTLPLLETLHIRLMRPRHHGSTILQDAMCPAMITPNLRSLCLENIYVPFSPKTLTSLTLSIAPGHEHEIQYVRAIIDLRFLDVLRHCDQLQELVLNRAIPDPQSIEVPEFGIPTLKCLRVTDTFEKALALLDILLLPPSAVRNLTIEESSRSVDTSQLFRHLGDTGKAISAVEISSQFSTVLFRFYEKPDPLPVQDVTKPSIHLRDYTMISVVSFTRLAPDSRDLLLVKFTQECATGMTLRSTHTLHIETADEFSAEQWALMLEPFASVQDLKVDVPTYARDIWMRRINQDSVVLALLSAPPILPLLGQLSLAELRFDHEFTASRIVDMLRSRQHHKMALKRFRVGMISFACRELGSAAEWAEGRGHFLEGLAEHGTHGEGFVAEPDETTEDPEVRRAREEREKRREELVRHVEAGTMNAELVLSMFDAGVDLGNNFMCIQ